MSMVSAPFVSSPVAYASVTPSDLVRATRLAVQKATALSSMQSRGAFALSRFVAIGHGHTQRTLVYIVAAAASDGSKSTVAASAALTSSLPSIVTDESVPEGHVGLHGFLYGDGGSDAASVHEVSDEALLRPQEGVDDGVNIVPLEEYVASREAFRFPGLYAVYCSQRSLQYVGFSRSVVRSIKTHRASVGEVLTASVRVRAFVNPDSIISRSRLQEERDLWLAALVSVENGGVGVVPPGNGSDRRLWESIRGGVGMSKAEREKYEEQKLRMRKAMGENLHDDEDESEEGKQRRARMMQAMQGDDWSAVIQEQTAGTRKPASEAVAAPVAAAGNAENVPDAAASGPIVSPFERQGMGMAGKRAGEEEEMTVASVDKALDEVRPYLIADGGNVEVVGVEAGIVSVLMQGACGTCPSSTATLKMGIERSLREAFGSQLREVVQVGDGAVNPNALTVADVDAHLDILRPAITGFGGRVQVQSVDPAARQCVVMYDGPPTVAMGIQAAVKDKFPILKDVEIVPF